jgi:hypothetical protein
LFGHESRCPACQKRVFFPEWFVGAVLIGITFLVVVGILAAGQLKTAADRSITRPQDAYAAAKEFVLQQPGVKAPAFFAPISDVVLEQWGPRKYRVSGRAEARDEAGRAVNLLYTCILERDRQDWALQDISVQLSK